MFMERVRHPWEHQGGLRLVQLCFKALGKRERNVDLPYSVFLLCAKFREDSFAMEQHSVLIGEDDVAV